MVTAPLALALFLGHGTVVAGPKLDANAEPTSDNRAAAATTAGVGAFVGVTLGGVIVPGAAGLIGAYVLNARPSSQDLVTLSTTGGAGGALVGSLLGALPTAEPWYGPPIVGVAGAAGALVGLLPSALYFGRLTPKTSDGNDPVRLEQSACLLVAITGSSAAAAGAGALLAAPGVGR